MKWHQLTELSDETLVKQLLDTGKDRYFEELYRRYSQKVYYQCLSYTKDSESAKDLMQDSFMRLYDKLGKFSFRSSLSTWVFQLVRNLCLDYLRKQTNWKHEEEMTEEAEMPEIEEKELLGLDARRLTIAMRSLSFQDQELLMLKYGHEWRINDISEITNLSVPAIKMRLKRAKSKVHKIYQQIQLDS
ncbi:MAG: sigma-70 family RNA polymerase sigma factor [Bacteroidota bacterium]